MTSTPLQQLEQWLSGQIIGQHDLIHKLLIALLADGHLLVEGAPGLAKTRAIKQMSGGIAGGRHAARRHAPRGSCRRRRARRGAAALPAPPLPGRAPRLPFI